MQEIHWTQDMSVGVEQLDGHHRRLIDLTNQLGAAIAAGNWRRSPARCWAS